MANPRLRLQIPLNAALSADFTDDRFFPQPAWGNYGSDDYPTVNVHQSGTKSTLTRNVKFWDNSTYSLPNANGCDSANAANFWKARDTTAESDRYYVNHTTGKACNWLFGHQGPASGNTVVQSWQRNVIGLSWQYKTGGTNSAGLQPKNLIALYRKKSDSSNFYGAWLIRNSGWASSTNHTSLGNTLFDTSSYPMTRTGKVSVNLRDNNNAITNWIRNEALVFQGFWFETNCYDSGAAQFYQRYYMYSVRLIFQDGSNYSSDRDYSYRIVLPRGWQFQNAFDVTAPVRLT